MFKKSKWVMLIVMAVLFLQGCGRVAIFANGENYYCPGESFLDIVQFQPELQVRFTCTDEDQAFEVVFGGPNDSELIEKIREKNQVSWGLGVILQDGKIIQLYELSYIGSLTAIDVHWRAPNN